MVVAIREGRQSFEALLQQLPHFAEWNGVVSEMVQNGSVPLDLFPAVLRAAEQSGQAAQMAQFLPTFLRHPVLENNDHARRHLAAFILRNGGREAIYDAVGFEIDLDPGLADVEAEWEEEFGAREPTQGEGPDDDDEDDEEDVAAPTDERDGTGGETDDRQSAAH